MRYLPSSTQGRKNLPNSSEEEQSEAQQKIYGYNLMCFLTH